MGGKVGILGDECSRNRMHSRQCQFDAVPVLNFLGSPAPEMSLIM
jgi:hypothetical protein